MHKHAKNMHILRKKKKDKKELNRALYNVNSDIKNSKNMKQKKKYFARQFSVLVFFTLKNLILKIADKF